MTAIFAGMYHMYFLSIYLIAIVTHIHTRNNMEYLPRKISFFVATIWHGYMQLEICYFHEKHQTTLSSDYINRLICDDRIIDAYMIN